MIKNRQYDVVIIGGGAGGFAAAIGAAQSKANVLIIERNAYLGGQATHCSIPTLDGFYTRKSPSELIAGGVAHEVIERLKYIKGCDEPMRSPWGNVMLPVNNESLKLVLDSYLQDVGGDVLFNTLFISAKTENERVSEITVMSDDGPINIKANAFVDASGECNLVAYAKGQFFMPEEGKLQVGSLLTRFGGVKDDTDISPNALKKAIQQAKQHGISPLGKDSGFAMKIVGTQDIIAILCNEKVNGLDVDSLTTAQINARKQAAAYLVALKQYLPGFEQAYLIQTGPQIGIRETRHAIGDYVITGDDVVSGQKFDDVVARGCWPIERHRDANQSQTYEWVKEDSYYEIPLRALKNKGLRNVWLAGRTVSCDQEAFASLRVMGTAFLTGHAAGIAAAISGENYQQDSNKIQRELKRQNAIL